MPKGYSSVKTSRWFLRHFLLQPWTEHALCIRHPRLPWTGVVAGDRDASPTDEQFLTMARVCADCPVLNACAEYALIGHNGNGVDGGFYAGVWIPWPTYYRHAQRDQSRRRARHALRRHVHEPVAP